MTSHAYPVGTHVADRQSEALGQDRTGYVQAHGRAYRVDLELHGDSRLVARTIRSGAKRQVAVRIPRPKGAVRVMSEAYGDPNLDAGPSIDPDLFIAHGQGFVSGYWCTLEVLDPDQNLGCDAATAFYARFSLRTGRVLDSRLSEIRASLIGGDRVSELVTRPKHAPVLRDAISRRDVLDLPRGVAQVQGAGPYVAWNSADHPLRSDIWIPESFPGTRIEVHRRRTGALRSVTRIGELRRASGSRRASFDDPVLEPDGSLGISGGSARRGFQPFVVDGRGRIRSVGRRWAHAYGMTSEIVGDRVLLTADPGRSGGPRACRRTGAWLSSTDGRRGYDLGRLPRSRGQARVSPVEIGPDPDLAVWFENPVEDESGTHLRLRTAAGLAHVRLTPAGAPRC